MKRTYRELKTIEPTTDKDSSPYVKVMIERGNKILPPVVTKEGEIIDGRKRIQALREVKWGKNIEVFIGNERQDGLPLLEGAEDEPSGGIVLAEGKDIRLENRENYHLHYGEGGKYRVILGKKDFEELSEAILWEE